MDGLNALIDRVYSAALDHDAWPTAVGAMQSHFGCSSAGLYTADMQEGNVALVHVRDVDPSYLDSYVDRYLRDNPWSRVPESQRLGHIRTDRYLDEHYNSPGYYRRTDLFNEWMKPQDFIYTLGINLSVERDRQIKLFLYRPERAGPFTRQEEARFKRLSGHLMNAVKVAGRLALEESRTDEALQVVDNLTFGVVFLDETGKVMQANPFALRLFERRDGLATEQGRVVTTHRGDASELAEILCSALEFGRGDTPRDSRAAFVRRVSGRRPLSVVALPLPRAAVNPFRVRRAAVALFVTDPELDPIVPIDQLRRRYKLTAAEARLAQHLTRGVSLRNAAEAAGITYETARWYLKSTFQKTGTARQTDLVRLLLADQLLIGLCE